MKPARVVQGVLLVIGAAASVAAVIDYFAPGMDGVVSVLVFLSPVLLAIGGPYALHWFTVRSPIVAVPTAAGFCVWGISFAVDVFTGRTPSGPLLSWFFLVLVQSLVVAACIAAGAVASAVTAGARRVLPQAEPAAAVATEPPRRTLHVVLATLIALLLIGAGFAAGRQADNDKPVALPPTSVPPAGGGPAAPGVAVDATFAAAPRSIAFQGDVPQLESIRLEGALDLSVRGSISDAAGRRLGDGILRASGSTLRLSGSDMLLTLDTDLIFTGGAVRAPNQYDLTSFGSLRSTRAVKVEAEKIEFQGAAGGPARVEGAASVTLDPEDFADPFTISIDGAVVWTDAPPSLTLSAQRSGRTTLSWAGGGEIVAGATFSHEFLGLKSKDSLEATIARADGSMRIDGKARAAQVYSGNLPQLRARAGVRVKSTTVSARRGGRGQFTWAPENVGDTDMVMSRIVPASQEATWISLGLDRMPQLCGGEDCPTFGGDTAGFQDGDGINAVILPLTGDERDIRFYVPDDAAVGRHTLVLVIEGNFDPVRVEVPVEITA